MVKTVLGVNHQGLRDWVIQRVSAIVMAIYVLGLFLYFVIHPDVTFWDWHNLFSYMTMKVATILFILSLLFHAWVGMWTVFTDYVKSTVLCLLLNTLVLLALLAFFFEALLILWNVNS